MVLVDQLTRRSGELATDTRGDPMINVPKIRAAAEQLPGDMVGISKEQLGELLDAAERGQRAYRELINLKSIAAVAGAYGAPL